MKKHRIALAIVLAFTLVPAAAFGEALLNKNVHYFQPPADGSGLIMTYGSEALTWWGMHYGVVLDDSFQHLTINFSDDREEDLVANQFAANVLFAVGITRYLNIGVAFPFAVHRVFNEDDDLKDEIPDDLKSFAVEDFRVDLKGIILDRRRRCLGVAINLTGTIPVQPEDNTFVSDIGFGVTPRLILDLGREWWTVAFNVAYRHNTESDSQVLDNKVRNELLLGGGATFRLGQYGQYGNIILDTSLRTPLTDFFSDPNANYGEVFGGYRYFVGHYSTVAITFGASVGIMDGVGTPTARGFLGVTVYEHHMERGR